MMICTDVDLREGGEASEDDGCELHFECEFFFLGWEETWDIW